MNNKDRYSLRNKNILGVCNNVVKNDDIKKILSTKTGVTYNRMLSNNIMPIYSMLDLKIYSGLISQATTKAILMICEIVQNGRYTDNLFREKMGLMYARGCCVNTSQISIIDKFEEKLYEFEKNKNKLKLNDMNLIFEYIDILTLLENAWKIEDNKGLISYDWNIHSTLVEEVRHLCRGLYSNLIKKEVNNIKESFIKSPNFTSKIGGFAGDGSFMIKNNLYSLKTKCKMRPEKEDVYQMVLYYLLSRCNKIYKSNFNLNLEEIDLVENMYIYNTRHNERYEIIIRDISDEEVDEIMEEVYTIYRNTIKTSKP